MSASATVVAVQFDFDEWNRMHFGPSAEQRDEALYKRYKEMNQSE